MNFPDSAGEKGAVKFQAMKASPRGYTGEDSSGSGNSMVCEHGLKAGRGAHGVVKPPIGADSRTSDLCVEIANAGLVCCR